MLLELEKPKVDCCAAIFVANLRTFWRNATVAYQNGQIRCVLVACEWLFKTGKIIQEHLNLERVRWGSAIAGPIKLAIFYFCLWWQGVQNWNHHSWTSQLEKDEVRKHNNWHLLFDIHWYSSFLMSGKNETKSSWPCEQCETKIWSSLPRLHRQLFAFQGCSTKQQTVLFHRCATTVVLLWDWFEMWETIYKNELSKVSKPKEAPSPC